VNQEDFVQVQVETLLAQELEELGLEIVTGRDGLDRMILRPRVQKPGLAFAGYYEYIKPGRVQIIGESETNYLQSLPPRLREKRVRDVTALDVSCFVVTKAIEPLREFETECERRSVPLFITPAMSSQAITKITYFLEEAMAPSLRLHACLLDIYGIGVLLVGDSGVGKSESALDLVSRGHRLVADDSVILKRHPNDVLLGYASERLGHHMELRGIGIVDIRNLFGVASTRDVKPIDLVVRLEKWIEGTEYDRLGIGSEQYEVLGVSRPFIRLPVAHGRNLALLIEIAARNFLIRLQGYNSAEDFMEKINVAIREETAANERNGGEEAEEPPRSPASATNKHMLTQATKIKVQRKKQKSR